jgi:fructose-specific phosphotransferase system IIA component
MQIKELIPTSCVVLKLVVTTKQECLELLLCMLSACTDAVTDQEQVRMDLLSREKIMSTGVGKGFAIPHCKTIGVTRTIIALATLVVPIEFDAIDGQPVEVVCMIISPEKKASEHLKVLARLSRVMKNLFSRCTLTEVNSPDSIIQLLEDSDTC